MSEKKINFPMIHRAASVLPSSFNKEARTFEVVFTTGARVRRQSFWDGPYYEELGINKENVRMGRLNNKAPFLDNHGFTDKQGVRSVLGAVQSAELISGKEGRAVIKLSSRSEIQDIARDIEDGILSNISVGYAVHRMEKVAEVDKVPVYRATDWEPMEISLVPAGADDNAKVRAHENQMSECIVVDEAMQTRSETKVETQIETRANPETEKIVVENKNELGQTDSTRGVTMDEKEMQAKLENEKTQARKAEKERCEGIRSLVKKVGLESDLADTYIKEDKTLDEVRTLVIDKIAEKANKEETQTRSAVAVEVGKDLGREGRVEGIANSLLHRFRPQTQYMKENSKQVRMAGFELSEAGRQFVGHSLIELARMCLEAGGVRTKGMSKTQIADLALQGRSLHSTSDFPEILANVANKTLRSGYQSAPITWRPFVREVFNSDFKQISRTNLGDAPKLEAVPEGGEVKRGTMSEAAEKYSILEYAKIVGVTRKTLINDDLGAFTLLPERMGRRAADLEADLIWNIIKANAAMSDGFLLFSTQHGNLSATPAAPSEAGLNEARAAIRRQKGLDGAELGLYPVWMFVPPAHETAAEKLLASIIPDSSSNVSPYSASGRTPLRLDVEPRLENSPNGSLTSWFVMADLGQVDMVELARLEGSDGPQIMTKEGFDVHGVEMKIMHDVGAKAIDHRGMFKNAGA